MTEFDVSDEELPSMGNSKRLRKNFYTLTAEFKLTAPDVYPDFTKTYKFKKETFAQNLFAIDKPDE